MAYGNSLCSYSRVKSFQEHFIKWNYYWKARRETLLDVVQKNESYLPRIGGVTDILFELTIRDSNLLLSLGNVGSFVLHFSAVSYTALPKVTYNPHNGTVLKSVHLPVFLDIC